MYVNPFWFGVLMTIVGLVVFSIIMAIVKDHLENREDEEIEEVSEEEFKRIVEETFGKKYKIMNRDGYMVAMPLDEGEDDESKAD